MPPGRLFPPEAMQLKAPQRAVLWRCRVVLEREGFLTTAAHRKTMNGGLRPDLIAVNPAHRVRVYVVLPRRSTRRERVSASGHRYDRARPASLSTGPYGGGCCPIWRGGESAASASVPGSTRYYRALVTVRCPSSRSALISPGAEAHGSGFLDLGIERPPMHAPLMLRPTRDR